MSGDDLLHLDILGLKLAVRAPERSVSELVRCCYAAFARDEAPPAGPDVEAECIAGPAGFSVRVSGCEERRAPDAIEAVRTLNHEIVQGLMLRRRDCFYVHAGVVAAGGRVLILPGLSQAGKSTLVVELLRRGADYLSDELFVYDPERERILGFPRAPKLREVCLAYFPELAPLLAGEGDVRFLPTRILGGATADRLPTRLRLEADAPAAAVIAPHWDERGDDRLRPKSTGRGVLDLAASALNFGTHRRSSIDLMARAIRGARCYSLEWHEPATAARRILEALDGVHA